ncbi:TIGR02265 family protein [Archangium lipolyticum]|uniref:TIGR02265 family protein n=1 Tax=Archangium lipolyticum TaxID=2970465 RepID=UPI002149D2AF|nr:TIGR02265 family protein [Archangium lipolyticum]
MRPREVKGEDRMVFVQVVEGLLRHGVGERVTPRMRERLRQAGLDLDRPLLPAYRLDMWKHCLHIIIAEVYPGVPREEAFRQLAARHVEGYGQTLVGRALLRLLRLLGPKRTVHRMVQALRSSDNYTEVQLKELGPSRYEMWMNSVLDAPGYAEELFTSFLRVSGAEEPRVVIVHREEEGTTYLLSWKER